MSVSYPRPVGSFQILEGRAHYQRHEITVIGWRYGLEMDLESSILGLKEWNESG